MIPCPSPSTACITSRLQERQGPWISRLNWILTIWANSFVDIITHPYNPWQIILGHSCSRPTLCLWKWQSFIQQWCCSEYTVSMVLLSRHGTRRVRTGKTGTGLDELWGAVRVEPRSICGNQSGQLMTSCPCQAHVYFISKYLAQDNDFPAFWLVP